MIPRRVKGLRAAVVALKPGASMDWHTTGAREELLIALGGRVQVRTATAPPQKRKGERKNRKENIFASLDVAVMRVGECVFLPCGTLHCVVNRSMRKARYLYVTAPAR